MLDRARGMPDAVHEERGLHRAECRYRADNERSSAVAERLGMTLDGVLREEWKVGDTFYDKQVRSVLAGGIASLAVVLRSYAFSPTTIGACQSRWTSSGQ